MNNMLLRADGQIQFFGVEEINKTFLRLLCFVYTRIIVEFNV